MIKQLIQTFRWAKRQLVDERGGAMVELAIFLPLLLTMVFGLIDFSQIILDKQIMCGLSRQGSNLASRGHLKPADVVAAVVAQGASLNIATNGRIILTEVSNNTTTLQPQIVVQQPSTTGISVTSSIGTGVGNPATVPTAASTDLNAGRTLYITEVFYSYSPMTPIGNFLKKSLATTLYEVAYF